MKKLLLFGAITLSLSSFGQVPNYVPINGLNAYYSFNGNSNDESGGGNAGTVNGATLTTDRFGTTNSAYSFDGLTNYIQLASPFYNGASTLDELSYSYWINPSNITSNMGVLHYDSYWRQKHSVIGANGEVSWGGANPSTYMGITSATNTIVPGQWQHIVLVFSSSTLSLYLNGNLLNTIATPQPLMDYQQVISGNSNGTNKIGCRTSVSLGNYSFFDGKIDDIGIWNRALTECEIQDLYYSGINAFTDVTQNGATLTADLSGATYQWLDCDNSNAQIIGETNQSYTPTVTGNYAVEINSNGCIDTSACVLVDFTGVNEINNSSIKVYPNPTNASFNIEVDINVVGSNYFIFDQLGKVVQKGFISSASQILDVAELSKGIYNLKIANSDIHVKLIKE